MFKNPHKDKGHYLYFFVNDVGEIIYIGQTNNSLSKRFKKHNHLPQECYEEVKEKRFVELNSAADLFVYEIYYINKYKPKFNRSGKGEDELSPDILLPEKELRIFRNDSEQTSNLIVTL